MTGSSSPGRRRAEKAPLGRLLAAWLTLVSFTGTTLAPAVARAEPASGVPPAEVAADSPETATSVREADSSSDSKSDASTDSKTVGPERELDSQVAKDAVRASSSDLPETASTLPAADEPHAVTTGGDKSGVTSQAISVPKGAGKIDGMGESFSAQLSTGIASFSVPFAIPAARGGAQASLGLSYSSGSGPGLAGMGFSVGVPFIARQTDRGLPTYDDRRSFHPAQDRFVFNGGQELVPICTVTTSLTCPCTPEVNGSCLGGALPDERMPPWSAGQQYFRPRVEGSFMRFFWSADHRTWRVQDKSGVTMELGMPLDGSNDMSALEVNPDASREIYRWHLVRQYDAYGAANPGGPNARPEPANVCVYKYTQDGGMAYLTDVFHTTPASAPSTTETSLYAHHVRLEYEQRSDPTFSYRSGFRIDQRLRLRGVDVASKPFNGDENSARRQVRRYHLGYEPGNHVSLLASVQVEGRCGTSKSTDTNRPVSEDQSPVETGGHLPTGTRCPRLPAMTLGYAHVAPFGSDGRPGASDLPGYEGFDERVREISSSPPHSVDEGASDLFDINSDGLPDVLVTTPGTYGPGHGVFFNSSGGQVDHFGPAQPMAVRGVLSASAGTLKLSNLNVVPLDLDGDAKIDLLHMPTARQYSMYTPELLSGAWAWVGRAVSTASDQSVKIDFGRDTLDTRVADVNFDGLVDVVVSTGTEFQTFYSLGRFPGGDGQFGQATPVGPERATLSNDPVRTCVPVAGGPVRFSDGEIQFAEMNGDGIPDILKLQRGAISYWPGRGNGVWGTGRRNDCPAGTFADDRELSMENSPSYSDIDGDSLRVDDVNGDGLDDLVQIRFDAVDVWVNVDGVAWTRRHIIRGTPASPSFANRVRLADINGSGTRDILWGNSSHYRYIDLQGGQKPWLLTRVENGLGKSTDIAFSTSTQEMLAADARGDACDATRRPWSSPWCSKMPTVAHVVKRVTESDNLPVAGRGASTYVTEYDYRDPVFEGRQREFRGFRKARARRIGDANSPTDSSESTFLLGECKDETVGARDNGVDDCAVSERWRDNPREALKGLPIVTEKYDEGGVYPSTQATTYRLRRLYVGLDGREVRHAFESEQRSILYDTALGAASSAGTVETSAVELELAPSPFDAATGDALALPAGARVDETMRVPVRQPSGRAEILSRSVVDAFGNQIVAASRGCVAGSACPTAEPGIAPDEAIFSYTLPSLPSGERTGWLYRTAHSYVKGSVHTDVRHDTTTAYTAEGDPQTVDAVLSGGLPLDRSVSASLPTSGSSDGAVRISTRDYSTLGLLTQESGASGRCRTIDYDAPYGMLPTAEAIHRDGSGGCQDPDPLVTSAAYDRGLAVPTIATNMQRLSTYVDYDAFGRLSELRRPADADSTRAKLPTVQVEYFLPTPENPVRHSIIHTRTQDGADASVDAYLEAYAFVDGFGRTRVTLAEAELAGQWIVGPLETYDAKGAVFLKYLESYYTGSPFALPFAVTPTTPYGRQRYDAFGRQLQTFDLDGTVTLQSAYHALSTDLFDAADIEPGAHQNTPATTRNDGHGRVISTTERLHAARSLEERHTRTQYLATGEPEVITRVRGAGTEQVSRWMRYDSLGRMVLNVEPNTTVNFTSSPNAEPSTLKAWRYAYDDAGDLIGTSDARGCGQNFFYDGTGRIIAEDYAPCEPHQAPYSAPNLATTAGVEVLYVYDGVSSGLVPSFNRPPDYDASSPDLRGRLAAVFSRGSATFATYDFLGRSTRSDLRVARPSPNNLGFEARYADRWYSKDFAYDAADREVASTTGATSVALQGTPQSGFGFPGNRSSSVVTTAYTTRGTVRTVAGSYGSLVSSIDRTADGLIQQIVYGDAANTTTAFRYDNRRRVRNVQTFRGAPPIWETPPTGYQPPPAPNGATSFQLLLQDEDYTYDVVSNPTEIHDWRIASEWPAGAKPVTRKIEYDDLYRVKRLDYEYSTGDDTWVSPFAPELGGSSDARRAEPSPHVSFQKRILRQDYSFDWLGNTAKTDDDTHGFYDRSLGTVTNDTASNKPYQLKTANNAAFGGTRTGAAATLYDAAGNLTRLDVKRGGPCLGTGECSHRFDYQWDEVGRLVRARRWDVAASAITVPEADLPDAASVAADLDYVYDASDERVIKTAHAGSDSVHTVYVFDSLELRRTPFNGADYEPSIGTGSELTETEVPYLFAHGVRLARVVFEQPADGEPRLTSAGAQHVFFELGDHLGSTSVVLDKATSELVERSTYQAFGAAESDYRPGRWKGFREDYGFTGKEEDVEVGLQYFGKRFLSPYLGRWVSADPLGVHAYQADLNLYAYVQGRVLRNTDPLGLQNENTGGTTGASGTLKGTTGSDTQSSSNNTEPSKGGSSNFLTFDPSSRAQARAAGAAMGGSAAVVPVGGELLLASAMKDLRGKLDHDVYNAWLQGVAGGAEAAGIAALATAGEFGGGGLALAPETGGGSVVVGGAVATGALAVAANAQVVVSMAAADYGKGTGPTATPSSSSAPEPSAAGANGGPKADVPYKRPSGATTPAQRASVQGKPCVDCGATTPKQVADHKTPLVKEHYETGTIDRTRMKSSDSVQPQCPTCSARQGADMSRYSREQRKLLEAKKP